MNKPLLSFPAILAALAVPAAGAGAAPAPVADWRELAISGDAIGYGDAASITRSNSQASARVMLGLRKPMGEEGNIVFLEATMRFSCRKGRYLLDKISALDAKGAVIAAMPGARVWKSVPKDTLHAGFRDFACGASGAPRVDDPFAAAARFWRPDGQEPASAPLELAGQFHLG